MEESDRAESACIYVFGHGSGRIRILALGAAGLGGLRLLLHDDTGPPGEGLRPQLEGGGLVLVVALRRRAAWRCRRRRAGRRRASPLFLSPGRVEADGDRLPGGGLQLELRGGEGEEGAVTGMLVVVGDLVQWRVAVVFLLNLLRRRAVHVVLVGASVVVPAAGRKKKKHEFVSKTNSHKDPAFSVSICLVHYASSTYGRFLWEDSSEKEASG
jgi:hypothetical protein